MWKYNDRNELYHHGVLGMKWGKRKARLGVTQTDGYRKALGKVMSNKTINKAANKLTKVHMNRSARKDAIKKETDKDVRLGMKRTKGSAAEVKKGLDAANKAIAEKKKQRYSEDAQTAKQLKKKKVSQMSNAELKKLNERQNLEQNYKRLNPSHVKKGVAFVAASAGVMNTALNLYNNSDKLISLGKKHLGR